MNSVMFFRSKLQILFILLTCMCTQNIDHSEKKSGDVTNHRRYVGYP